MAISQSFWKVESVEWLSVNTNSNSFEFRGDPLQFPIGPPDIVFFVEVRDDDRDERFHRRLT